ncbi:MAG: hypothetical protein JWQ09_1224 [Segetibacter sp.]|nr:hypothetical protein [Segetibacter sp.]
MRNVLISSLLVVLMSCNNTDKKPVIAESNNKPEKATVNYPYPINYSSQFEIGDPEKAKIILDLWKDFDNNTLDNSASKFADTVSMLLSNTVLHGSRDSIIASAKAYRGSYSSVESKVDAVLSTKSTDKNEDWVLVWGTEVHTDKKNVTDSVHLQETWRLNKDGKVDFMMQYVRHPAVAKK